MTKRKRTPRSTNKVANPYAGSLIKLDAEAPADPAGEYRQDHGGFLARSSLFSAQFEAIIEIIARDRVYRAMMARMGRRLLVSPLDAPQPAPRLDA